MLKERKKNPWYTTMLTKIVILDNFSLSIFMQSERYQDNEINPY